ncbi:Hypothetical protein HDN1F_27320 [gamma proteobacterium HdN1]|nr:Hypothetical protein HDN1F_27320 [gamma proteobacterium HdN1]
MSIGQALRLWITLETIMLPHQHLTLLMRWERGLALKQLISAVIKPGMRVLDAGTGTGVAALWAAQAGAEVVGVDRGDLEIATQMAKANGLAERVRFLQADLNELTPDLVGGRFDALIAMVYFNDARRDEAQSRLVHRLCENLLHPGAIRIPDQVVYTATLCEWPTQDLETRKNRLLAQQQTLEGYYDLQFWPLMNQMQHSPPPSWYPERGQDGMLQSADLRVLSPVWPAFNVNYEAPGKPYPTHWVVPVNADGLANAVLWAQALKYKDTLIFRNESISWCNPALKVSRGETISAALDAQWRAENTLRVSTHQLPFSRSFAP